MKSTLFVLALLLGSSAEAQTAGATRRTGPPDFQRDTLPTGQVRQRPSAATDTRRAAPDAFSEFLFAPEQVMRNQASISLQEAQRTRILTEMSSAQNKFTEIQWSLSAEEEKLNALLREPAPAEQAVLAQMDRVLALEQNLKRTQMTMLLRIKSVLTPEQQARLRGMRGGAGDSTAVLFRRGG